MQLSVPRALRPGIAFVLAFSACGCLSGCDGSMPPAARAVTQEVHAALPPPQAQATTWSAPVSLSLVPAAGAVLPNGKVMLWAADGRRAFGGGLGHTYTTLFDPSNNTAVETNVTATGHDMFCPGTTRLADGRLFVNGGLDAADTSLYDPVTNAWTAAPPMNIGRGYNTSTTLADGSVLTIGGSWAGSNAGVRTAEVYTAQGGWRLLPGLPEDPFRINATYGSWQDDSHMTLVPTANGKVLLVGPTVNMAWIDPSGNGSWAPAGTRGDDNTALGELTVMYDAGKILKAGGAPWNAGKPASAASYLIDTTGGAAVVRKVANMAYPRMYGNGVVLPNGQVMMIGGQTFVQEFSDSNAVLPAELFDPATETYTVLPAMSVPRTYHSIALLLPDARILAAGGGVCNCAADHPDLQIMAPPYLFNADGTPASRPKILSAPQTLTYGATIAVATDSAVTAFSLVRLGTTTHTVDNDQRRLPLSISGASGNTHQLAIPTNPGLLLPGQWMLFALNAQGTPSVAAIVTIGNGAGLPVLQNPGTQNLKVGQSLYLALSGTASRPLTWSSPSLPAGFSLTAAGALSGTPAAAGNSVITLSASDGTQTLSTDFLLSVTDEGTGTGLAAQYFGGIGLAPPALLTHVETPYFDWGTGSPGPGVPADLFSVRWSGSIEAVGTGVTTLSAVSDDGIRIWVDNVLVIDNWSNKNPTTFTAPLNWVAGHRYPIMIEHFENTGAATMRLSWQPPGAGTAVPVPASHLYPATLLPATNLAQGGAATQSSTATGGEAFRAVDGRTDGNFANGSVASTSGAAPQDWWQVDLGSQSRIDTVQLWNRTDCCAANLMNFAVFVSANDMTGRSFDQLRADPTVILRAVLKNTNAAPGIGIPVNGTGRFVRVQMAAQKVLALAEVQVWGGSGASYHTPGLAVIANQQTAAGSAVSLATSGTDPDGNPISYSATGLPPGLSIAAASGLITGTANAAGSYSPTVTVANAGNLTASRTFTWTVSGSLPTVTSIPAPVTASGSAVNYAPAISSGSGATFSWNFGDGSAATAASGNPNVSHTFANPGVYTVTLLIQTGDGQSATQSFMQAISSPGATALSRASSNLALETRSGAAARLWVVNQDNDSVSVFDTSSGARLAEIAVGSAPRSVAIGTDGTVWVSNKVSATLSAISPSSLTVTNTLPLPRASQPFGILVSPTDGSLYVALEGTGLVLKLNASGVQQGSVAINNAPRHLGLLANGTQLFVSRFITKPMPGEGTGTVSFVDGAGVPQGGEVVVVNPATLAVLRTLTLANSTRTDTELSGRGIPNYLGAVAISPDGKSAWVPSKQDDIQRGGLRDGNALNFQNTVRSITSRLDLTRNAEDLAGRVDHDNAGVASAALYHPSGVYVFVALETNRQVAVLDAAGKRELFRYEVGLAPQGLALSADGQTLYVNNFMDRTVGVVDLKPLLGFGQNTGTPAAWKSIASEHLTAPVLRGKQLFYDARDPRLARDSYLSCASCHNDGGFDGRTWDFTSLGEGLRNTLPLRGRAGTGEGFLHWSANFDEVQDFEGQIRSLAGGTGLMSDAAFNAGTRSQPLGDPKAGQSADLDALAAYLGSLSTFASSPYRAADGTLTAAALSGKAVFLNKSCAGCHGGAGFTLSADGAQLKNIGTIKPSSGQRLGQTLPGIDIPTLRDVWATAPYLHDGSAATLQAAITAHNGVTLSAGDLNNVAEYLREIGGEEPASPGLFCSAERATCTLPAGTTATVSFGAGNSFVSRTGISGGIACSTATFGDPAPGAGKACYYVITSQGSVGTGTGLSGSYFATKDLTGAVVLARTEAVNFNWGSTAPGPGLPASNWSARWTGSIEAPATGSFQIQTNSDDVIRVWVNGVQVINNWVSHAPTLNTSAALAFTAGQKVPVTIEYAQYAGGAVAQLLWLKPGDASFNAVPADRLYAQ